MHLLRCMICCFLRAGQYEHRVSELPPQKNRLAYGCLAMCPVSPLARLALAMSNS